MTLALAWLFAPAPVFAQNAYITNQSSNDVSVIHTATNKVVATIPVGTFPFGVAVTQDGSKVYVANRGSGTVSVIATATNTVLTTIPAAGTSPFEEVPKNWTAFCDSVTDNFRVINPADFRVRRRGILLVF
jgi:YVTN family beta-propeller protein